MTRKKFKFKVEGEAEHVNEDSKALKTFTEEVNQWYDAIGRSSLEDWFKEKKVKDSSYLTNFQFADRVPGVEKESGPADEINFV